MEIFTLLITLYLKHGIPLTALIAEAIGAGVMTAEEAEAYRRRMLEQFAEPQWELSGRGRVSAEFAGRTDPAPVEPTPDPRPVTPAPTAAPAAAPTSTTGNAAPPARPAQGHAVVADLPPLA